MAEDDLLQSIRVLLREEIGTALDVRLSPFERRVDENFEALFARDEKREQEYLVMAHQLGELERDLAALKKKIA